MIIESTGQLITIDDEVGYVCARECDLPCGSRHLPSAWCGELRESCWEAEL